MQFIQVDLEKETTDVTPQFEVSPEYEFVVVGKNGKYLFRNGVYWMSLRERKPFMAEVVEARPYLP